MPMQQAAPKFIGKLQEIAALPRLGEQLGAAS
jgi:hypothetical protein